MASSSPSSSTSNSTTTDVTVTGGDNVSCLSIEKAKLIEMMMSFGSGGSNSPTSAAATTTVALSQGNETTDEKNLKYNKILSNLFSDYHKFVWLLPPVLSVVAFITYTDTSIALHNFIDSFASCNAMSWKDDKGADMIKDILNGPVALSVSILLGTLVAMTIQTLYDNKQSTYKTLIASIEEMREFNLILSTFPEPYRTQCRTLLNKKYDKCTEKFSLGVIEPESLRQNSKDMAQLRLLLQELSTSKSDMYDVPPYIDEAYNCLNNMKTLRSEMLANLQTTFSFGHYGNILILAISLLLVFLLETDVSPSSSTEAAATAAEASAQLDMLEFPLSICWALLVGTFTMLFAVIYDLRYRSVIAIQDTLERTGQSFDNMRAYATFSDTE